MSNKDYKKPQPGSWSLKVTLLFYLAAHECHCNFPISMAYLSYSFRRHHQRPTPSISNLYQGYCHQVCIRSTHSSSSIVSQSNSIPRSQPINGILHPQTSMCEPTRLQLTGLGLPSTNLELLYPRSLITISVDIRLPSTNLELPYLHHLITTSADHGLPLIDLEFPYSHHSITTRTDLGLPWIYL